MAHYACINFFRETGSLQQRCNRGITNGERAMRHSVIIVTRRRSQELRRLLTCLRNQTRAADDIVIVDASDDDDTADLIASERRSGDLPIRFLRTEADICAQRNAALELSLGDFITFLDDDVVLPPGYFACVMDRFAGDETLAGLSGLLANPVKRNLFERAFRHAFLLQTDKGTNRYRISGIPDFGYSFSEERSVDFVASTAASFRGSAIGATRFDGEAFGAPALGLPSGRAFAEDVAFSTQVALSGPLLLLPALTFEHYPSRSGRDDTRLAQTLYIHALRTISARRAHDIVQKAARIWALFGAGLLCVIQSIAKADSGYVLGYFSAFGLAGKGQRED